MTILSLIACARNLPMEDAYEEYGDEKMIKRMNTAIKLAKADNWPVSFIKQIETIRLKLQREGGGLAERRNLFVHGVHAAGENHGETELTMVRWKGDNRRQVVTILDAAELANQITILTQKAQAIRHDYGVWKFDFQNPAQSHKHIAQTKALSRFVRTQNIKRALKLLLANLKP